MITTFDDFNDRRDAAAVAGAGDPRPGWFSSVINVATGNLINLNDPGATPQPVAFQSSLRVLPGTIEDAGVNLQIVGGTDGSSPHVWIQDRDADAAGGDNTSIVFACRVGVGLAAAAAGEVWQGKFFVGFAISGDVQVLNNTTGEIDLATDGPLLGFHMAEDGHIDLISVRDGIAGPLVDGTHFTQLVDTSWNANLQPELGTANHQPTWFDLALRVETRDVSNAADNGAVQGFVRRLQTDASRANVTPIPGRRPIEPSHPDSANPLDWRPQGVVLENQVPHDTGLEVVPTVEIQNGGAVVGEDVYFLMDWWAMGISRASRR
jgi:hypothetical protein